MRTARKIVCLAIMAVASFLAGYFVAWVVLLLGWPSEPSLSLKTGPLA